MDGPSAEDLNLTPTELGIDPSPITNAPPLGAGSVEAVNEPAAELVSGQEDEAPKEPPPQVYEAEKRTVGVERRQVELAIIGKNLINRKIQESTPSIDSDTEQGTPATVPDSVKKLQTANGLRDLAPGVYPADADGKPGIDVSKGENPMLITIDGQRFKIARILSGNESDFQCSLVDVGGHGANFASKSISREMLHASYLRAESKAILSNFSGDELVAVQTYIQVENGQTPTGLENPNTDALINKLAEESTGITTVQDIDGYIGTRVAQGELSPEMQATITEINVLLAGKNILDAASMMSVLDRLGCNTDTLTKGIEEIQAHLTTQQAALEANPNNEEAKNAVDALTYQLGIFNQAKSSLGENGGIVEFFKGVESGTQDLKKAKDVNIAIRSGNMVTIIATIAPELAASPDDTPEQALEKNQKIKELAAEMVGRGLVGLGALLVLLWKITAAEAKSLPKALK